MRAVKWPARRCLPVAALTLCLTWLAACSDATGPRVSDPEYLRVLAMGFRPDMVHDRGAYFLVEGDIMIAKRAAEEPAGDTVQAEGPRPRFQYRTTNLVSHAVSQSMRVKILSSVESGWAAATRSAMTEWSSITGTVIVFTENATADITVSMNSGLDANTAAQAAFPVGSPTYKPGATIWINPTWNYLSASQKLFIMAHEFGHTVGFRHTNWYGYEDQNPLGAWQIGNTTTDAASVMNRGTAGYYYSGFSTWDIAAARMMYPQMPVVSIVDQGAGNPFLVSWTQPAGVVSFAVNHCYEYWTDYEGQPYSYYVCGSWYQAENTYNGWINAGDGSCNPYFQILAKYADGNSIYWSGYININSGCPY